MKSLASSTNDYYFAPDASHLSGVYDLIASSLCRFSTNPPLIIITNPVGNQIITWPASFRIDTSVSDPQNGLTHVDFYGGLTGTNWIGSRDYNPFSVIWSAAPAGTNVLRAIAYNEFGLSATSSVTVILNPPPVVFAGTNQDAIWNEGSNSVSLTLHGASSDEGLPYHILTNQWSQISGPGSATVTFTSNTLTNTDVRFPTNGTYVLRLIASDGAVTNASFCTNRIFRRPFVNLTAPTNYSVFIQDNLATFAATAWDIDGTVTNIQFLINGSWYSSTSVNGSNVTAQAFWNCTVLGTNTITAVATDNDGLTNSSSSQIIILAPSCIPAPANLVAWWQVDSNAVDRAGAHNGTLAGSYSFITGKVNKCINLSANSSGITVTNSADLNFGANADFSIEAWIKPQVATTSYGVMNIVDKRVVVGTTKGYEFCIVNGQPLCQLSDASGSANFGSGSTDLRDGYWHHVAVTINRTNSSGGIFYVDGQAISTFNPTSHAGDLTATNPLLIARHPDTTLDCNFRGGIDEVSLYSRALSASEILGIYNASKIGKCSLMNIQITSPTNSQIFVFSPTNILITVTGYTSGATLSNVALRANASSIGVATQLSSNLYQLLWTNVQPNIYSLTANATNSQGNIATATNNNVIVNGMAIVAVTFPTNTPATNFAAFAEHTNLTLWAHASDSGGSITNVRFYCPTGLISGAVSTTNNHDFSLVWSNLAAGTYPVKAIAIDNSNAAVTSSIEVFKVLSANTNPTVWITYPANGATLASGIDLAINASTTNGSGTVTNVEFFVDRGSIGSDSLAPYSATVHTLKPGSYSLLALATDDRGVSTVSTQVNISVVESQPIGTSYWDPNFYLPSPDDCGYIGKEGSWCDNGAWSLATWSTNLYLTEKDYESATSLWRWDGANWNRWAGDDNYFQVGGCRNFPYIGADAVTVDGTNMYVIASLGSGGFTVATLSGTNWIQLGPGFEVGASDTRLTSYPQVTPHLQFLQGDLYLYGDVTGLHTNGGPGVVTNIQYLARWDTISSNWVSVGAPLNGPVLAMADLNGHLFIGGMFTNASGNTNASHIAELAGGTWTNLGSGISGTNIDLYYLLIGFDDVASVPSAVFAMSVWGTNLVVGGDFTCAGNVTNVGGIALWNGSVWSSVGGGLQADSDPIHALTCSDNGFVNPIVRAIASRGNDLYVGGSFTSAQNKLGGSVPVSLVAKATWSESTQEWTWSDMDFGLSVYCRDSLPRGDVSGLVTMDGPQPGSYDVVVSGVFEAAGANLLNLCSSQPRPNNRYNCVARWRVGFPPLTNSIIVTLTNPAPQMAFTDAPVYLTLQGRTMSGSTNIDTIQVLASGTVIGSASPPLPTNDFFYSFTSTTQLDVGPYLLKAVATDYKGNQGETEPILITVRGTNFLATNDVYTIVQGSPTVSFSVLANDALGVRIKDIFQPNQYLGFAERGHDGTYIRYTPQLLLFGTDRFAYTVTNSLGQADFAWVTVNILSKPIVNITRPLDNVYKTNVSSLVNFEANAFSYDSTRSITNTALWLNGSLISQTNSNKINLAWSTNVAGFYVFTASTADSSGITNGSSLTVINVVDASATNVVTASIDNLQNNITANFEGITVTNIPVVRDALFDLLGKARDSQTGHVPSYKLELLRPEDNADWAFNNPDSADPVIYKNVTPGALDVVGFHSGGDITNYLGRLDLSSVLNGTYDLLLTVHGGGKEAQAWVRFRLESNLKIGQFSFSEQDLILPVNGMPLTVTRTYNSLNPRTADFGYSWTMALNAMDVQLDDQRQDVTIGGPDAPVADDETDENGLPKTVSIRTGGGWDVTLTLPDGRRTTFAFTPDVTGFSATAKWTAPPDVHATLTPKDSNEVDYFPSLHWWQGGEGSTFDNHDVQGWILTTQDGTEYHITRGLLNNVTYFPDPNSPPINVQAYGPPTLTKIRQRTGDEIHIDPSGVSHWANGTNLTRQTWFERDDKGRIISVRDPNSGSNGLPVIQYIYNRDSGNLIQVLKLTDRNLGTYVTNRYHYDNPNFPHYITSIENPLGVPVARNLYDDAGALTGIIDANGNTNLFVHSLSNQVEIVVDRLGHTNITGYDLRGNVTATTNALGGVRLAAFDDNDVKTNEIVFLNGVPYATNRAVADTNGWILASINALGFSNTFSYNTNGQVLASTDARHNSSTNFYDNSTGNCVATADALGNMSSNFFNSAGLLVGTRDPFGTHSTNYFDDAGNVIASALFQGPGSADVPVGTSLSTNSAAFDSNGNQTNSVTWRRVNGAWVGATNNFNLDAQSRRIATIAPDGGVTRTVFDNAGHPIQTIDALNHTNFHDFDFDGREYRARYPDGTSEWTLFNANDIAYAHVDRAGHTNYTILDALNRAIGTAFADGSTNWSIPDDLGRIKYIVDARGSSNAPGYDVLGQRITMTNALGTPQQSVTGAGFDENGNEIYSTNALGVVITNLFDVLNRQFETDFPDGTRVSSGYNALGQRFAQTNQDGVATWFGSDGLGRLWSVTNAVGITNQEIVTKFVNDEAGNQVQQIDANNHTNLFEADGNGRRIRHMLPGGQSESWGFDLAGNQIRHTNFNGIVITNEFNEMNRLTNTASIDGYRVARTYALTGQLKTMTDMSGATVWQYNERDWLTNKTVSFNGGPTISLSYSNDANGEVSDIFSSSTNGVNLHYDRDPLERITNVLAHGTAAASYHFDLAGNVDGIKLANGVTNLTQHDRLNRLTNVVWNLGTTPFASFYYQLGLAGNRTNLIEGLNGTTRNYAWQFDWLYRLTNETISDLGSIGYAMDAVGNRTSRISSIPGITNQSSAYLANDWVARDAYDSNGNTIWSTNAGPVGPFNYNADDRLTNFGNSVYFGYNGDGLRASKIVGGTNFYFVWDDRNPSGYSQVLEEWVVASGATNLLHVYNVGLRLVSQQDFDRASHLPSSVWHFVFDGHGSTRLLADSNGTISNAFAFDAYGNLLASNLAPQTAYLYCGEQFDFNLGHYYLRQRTYDPGTGRFPTSDRRTGRAANPLSLHRYLYAHADPANGGDPLGEAFFAFDGTANWENETDQKIVSPTNVRKMYEASGDLHKHYLRGVGNQPDNPSAWGEFGGQAFGAGMSAILDDAWDDLKTARDKNDKQVDIVGFSRGGIEAIEFANRIADAFKDETIRFVGLYDPVGSVGMPGAFGPYRSTLPAAVQHSAQAFAQNENRSFFPATQANAKVQQWFRGVHSDIGGGFKNHDIADYVLQWMTDQATSSGVSLDLTQVKQKYGWNPQANGMINRNSGFTSWFTDGGSRAFAGDSPNLTPVGCPY